MLFLWGFAKLQEQYIALAGKHKRCQVNIFLLIANQLLIIKFVLKLILVLLEELGKQLPIELRILH
jgi:hypothetical protein